MEYNVRENDDGILPTEVGEESLSSPRPWEEVGSPGSIERAGDIRIIFKFSPYPDIPYALIFAVALTAVATAYVIHRRRFTLRWLFGMTFIYAVLAAVYADFLEKYFR